MSILINNKVVAGSQPMKEIGLDNLSSELVDLISQRSSDLFDIKYSDHILEGNEAIGWALQGTYVYKTAIAGQRYGYPDFYARCLNEKAAATPTETTLGSNTMTLYVHTNGHKFYDIADKTAVDAWFNTYGIADFFGIDTVNQCIFLPRNNYFFQLTTDVSKVNDLKEAGLPNITGKLRLVNEYNFNNADVTSAISGAFSTTVPATAGATINQNTTPTNDGIWAVTFDASRSSDVYGNSNTVQPQSSLKLLYYRVGNTINSVAGINIVEQVEEGIADIENAKNNSVAELASVTAQSLKDVQDTTNDGLSSLANASNALRETQITNCIKEIPQRIKADVTDGTLTVYAGTVAIVPYGIYDLRKESYGEIDPEKPDELYSIGDTFKHENFKIVDMQFTRREDTEDNPNPENEGQFIVWVEVQNNINHASTVTDTAIRLCEISIDTNTIVGKANTVSGTVDLATSGVLYNITTNLVKNFNNEGNSGVDVLSLPLLAVQADGTNVNGTLEETFNGFGYIGLTYWVDKGVKGLIPNGRNEDGTLKNRELILDKIGIKNYTYDLLNGIILIFADGNIEVVSSTTYSIVFDTLPEPQYYYERCFVEKENKFYYHTNGSTKWIQTNGFLPCGTVNIANGKTTNFNLKQSFRAVDWYDLSTIGKEFQESIDNLKIAIDVPTGFISYYPATSPPNGYLVCNGGAISRNTYSKLFSVIGTTFGTGDGSTTFNLPLLTDNRFIEGYTTVGSKKAAGLPNISGTVGNFNKSFTHKSGAFSTFTTSGNSSGDTYSGGGTYATFSAKASNSIYGNSTTVQPKALTLLPCIKY